MAIYEIASDRLREIKATSFGAAGVQERADLQRLLRSQIEVVVPDVLIIAEEFGAWEDSKRRIDLLGLDKDANLVVIELKRSEDGGHMELQAIRYAAMISAMTFDRAVELYADHLRRTSPATNARTAVLEFLGWEEPDEEQFGQDVRIVLVSADFSKELTTAVMWLNERSLDITCVRIKPYQDNGRLLVDVAQVIPLPEAADYIVKLKEKEVRERTARREQSDLRERLLRFWTTLQARAAAKTGMHRHLAPSRKNWFGGRHNAAGMNFNYVIGMNQMPRVEAYIFGTSDVGAKAIYDGFWKEKAQIEGRFGSGLAWERMDDKIASRIRADLDDESIADEDRWPELRDRMIDMMIRLEKALRPAIQVLGI